MSAKFPKNPTPAELRKAYTGGFAGSKCDPEDLAALMGDLRHPLFGVAAHQLASDGEGKVSLPFKSLLKFDAGFGPSESQTTGDCVAHATRNAVDLTRAVEIDVKGEEEGFLHRGATEAIYGCRGHSGQGMACSKAARFVCSEGGILLRKNYGFIDLSTYDSSVGTGWGRKGVPDDVEKEGRRHSVNTVSLVVSVEEARDALSNGYSLSVCSGVGFSSRRNENGYANRKGSWSHAMAWIGCNDTKKDGGPGFLVQNSWGKWNGGGKKFDQPDGSFWIDYNVAASMLSARGAWVFSDVNGFPPRKLPDYGKSLWG
jgi:hypothetical protein|tara:strand:+ start:2288 stop:3229 length:942 start_codon:yes stop_codon:yes gene_type:complete